MGPGHVYGSFMHKLKASAAKNAILALAVANSMRILFVSMFKRTVEAQQSAELHGHPVLEHLWHRRETQDEPEAFF